MFAPKLPLALDDITYIKNIDTLRELVRQNLKILVLTNQGEKTFDSNFGVGMRKVLFQNESRQLVSDIKSIIISQTERYMPYLRDIDLEIDTSDSQNGASIMNVRIGYVIDSIAVRDVLEMDI